MTQSLRRLLAAAIGLTALCASEFVAADRLSVPIVYLERQIDPPPTLSNLDPKPDDLGVAGARLGVQDNQTTGRFLGQDYALETIIVAPEDDFAPAAVQALEAGGLIVVDAPAADLLALADLPGAAEAMIFNAGAQDDALRGSDCRANVLHAIPSRAMLTDALAQFLTRRRWSRWFVIRGVHPGDQAYAAAVRRSARKFGARIITEKTWAFDADMRRNAAQEVPIFTQGPRYDALIVADELEDFGRYILYNTWDPRPVAGTEGLSPRGWAPVVEQWGAAQLNSRFAELSGRGMLGRDYAAWAAVRSIGEAAARTGSADPAALRAYILSDRFALAGFKGRRMSYRPWNGQLRQPIPLVHPRALAGQAPIEGFLHQTTELDTLGYDAPESVCAAFE